MSSLLGTVIEYYDFLLYSTMAALVFGRLFFPNSSGATATIAAFGTLAAGYVARPVGGILFGHFGDRVGRKTMLVLSMVLMGGASFLIGVLPTFHQIGMAAPILLVALRVVQGVAVGGEWGGAALMVIEHADPRRRGAWVGLMQLGSPLGSFASSVAVMLVTMLPDEQFYSWGWRIPFLLSGILLVIGLYVRMSVAESPIFAEAAKKSLDGARLRPPALEVLRRPKNVILACGVGIGPFVLTALITSQMLAYAKGVGFASSDVVRAMLFTSVVAMVCIPLFSALSDRVGRRTVSLAGVVGSVVVAFPLYAMVNSGSVLLLTLGMMIAQVAQNAMYAPLAPMLSEMFGTGVRYTGVSMGYQAASLIGAGFTPMVATALVESSGGSSLPLSLLIVAGGAITVGAIWAVSETRGRDLNSEPASEQA
ncbi:MHS family MFS transporter [Gordonia sp. PDNC005]|uniref:MFS transporter n=1 Tax=unclassified Gordonia (in: high G+C Gram-positive bacteria) TaxID=2657482 RepID=UPI0019663DDF|nr:MFS transporter [Gordonia sp. PDNC005]QRY64750.1 MHS family MFS transporter [Gordonia sp. PDNC005]